MVLIRLGNPWWSLKITRIEYDNVGNTQNLILFRNTEDLVYWAQNQILITWPCHWLCCLDSEAYQGTAECTLWSCIGRRVSNDELSLLIAFDRPVSSRSICIYIEYSPVWATTSVHFSCGTRCAYSRRYSRPKNTGNRGFCLSCMKPTPLSFASWQVSSTAILVGIHSKPIPQILLDHRHSPTAIQAPIFWSENKWESIFFFFSLLSLNRWKWWKYQSLRIASAAK